HLGDARHADAADADEVDWTDVERQRPHAATPAGRGTTPVSSPTRSARRAAASGRPAAWAATAMSASRCGVARSSMRSAASADPLKEACGMTMEAPVAAKARALAV